MKKEIRVVNQGKGLIQITTIDERWYARSTTEPTTGLPAYKFVPSVTWICEHYPKGVGFYKWLANTGWDEAQALKEAAGDKGSKVHHAIGELFSSGRLPMDASLLNPSTGQMEALSTEEYEALMSFAAWHNSVQPVSIAREFVVWNDQEGYAGTVDFLCLINGDPWLIDFKTSQAVWPSHELQVSAYTHARCLNDGAERVNGLLVRAELGILQLGYRRNKGGWKFTEIADQFPLFVAVKQIWAKETAGQQPAQKDYPLVLTITPHAPTLAEDGATQPTQADGASASQGEPAGGTNESHRGRTTSTRIRAGATG